MLIRVNDTVVDIFTNVNQHLNKWAHGKTAPSFTVVCTVCSFMLTTEIGDEDFFQSKENLRSLSPRNKRGLCSMQRQPQTALIALQAVCHMRGQQETQQQAPTWEVSGRPSSKPVGCCCCCQTPGWKVTAQYPAAATHILRVCRGGSGSLSTAKWAWEEGEEWHYCQPASHRRGWLQSSGSFLHIHHMHKQTFEPNCFLTALLCSTYKIHGLGKHLSLCRTPLFLQ